MYDMKTDEASGNFRIPSIRNLNLTGYSETYQQNKKSTLQLRAARCLKGRC